MIRVTRPYDSNTTLTKSRRSKQATGTFSIDKEAQSGIGKADAAPESGLLGVLIALQGGEHPPQNDTIEWSHQALDDLERLRDDLLLGGFDSNSIQALSDQIENSMQTATDPILADLQAQILLRAKVELAKVELAESQSKTTLG